MVIGVRVILFLRVMVIFSEEVFVWRVRWGLKVVGKKRKFVFDVVMVLYGE